MSEKRKKPLSLSSSLLWIVGSLLLVSGSIFSLGKKPWKAWLGKKEGLRSEIVAILQTGPEKEALSSTYLAQLMDLSVDEPTNADCFDREKARNKLLSSPLIKEAEVEVIKPGTVFVDYTVRKPVAKLHDFENTAFDASGHLFPLFPFITPRNLPEIYLGLKSMSYKEPLEGEFFALGKKILTLVEEEEAFADLQLHRVDVSKAHLKSYGKREVIIVVHKTGFVQCEGKSIRYTFPYFLRLLPEKYVEQLENFISLRQGHFLQKEEQCIKGNKTSQLEITFSPTIIDLRLDQLAYIQCLNP